MKIDLNLRHPLMNAAGSLGFAFELRSAVDPAKLGAFVTNPVSLNPRSPARGERCLDYPGGFLLHTGYPNPGIKAVLRQYARRWLSSPLPVLVHLIPANLEEAAALARLLEGIEGVAGIELGIPSGLAAGAAAALVQAAGGELPIVACLPFEQAIPLSGPVSAAGASAISLAPPRGVLPWPGGELLEGRLYGPSVFPSALAVVRAITQRGLAVIGSGGVYHSSQVEAMLTAGASAVQLDAVLWRGSAEEIGSWA